MSIRSVWIISVLPESIGKVLFYRKFPTVEERAQKTLGGHYINISSGNEFSSSLLLAFGLSCESKQFVEWRDHASKDMHLPVVTVKIKEKELWPILVVEQLSCLICCLPYVETKDCKDIFYISSVSVGFSVLVGILNFLGPNTTYVNELEERFPELDNYLTISMPFGAPSVTDSTSVVAFYNEPLFFPGKQSCSKQLPPKGKSFILIEINEYVRSSQGNQHNLQPIVQIYGNVDMKLESLSQVNEMSLALEHYAVGKALVLDSITIHPSVQSFSSGGVGASSVSKKFQLIPSLHRFTLCFYSACCTQPPITGIFKMKGIGTVELLIELKLNEGVKNSFSSCTAYIPFFHRGPIVNFEFKATQGFLHVSEDRRSLKWNIGSKFSKSLDAILTAKVHLSSEPLNRHNDPFCIGKNAYIQILFKCIETLSGCNIDPKSVTISPPHKTKISIESSVQSTDYRIWNSFGDLPFPIIPKDKLPKE